MRKRSKWIALGLAAAMLTGSLLTGCGSQNGAESQSSVKSTDSAEVSTSAAGKESQVETTSIDTSEHVELVCYFVGDPPTDIQKIQDKINESLEEKINATISFQFTTWTDYKNKYSMILSGGENCDIIFTAPWMMYYSMIEKDAFMDLNDLIDEYAPELREAIEPSFFEETYIDGALYTLPNNYKEYTTGGIIYREDLRKKYNLPVPDSMENLEAYMAGIKENEPNMQVVHPKCANYLTILEEEYALNTVGLRVPYNDVHTIEKYWGSEKHIAEMTKIKEWADAGYWSSDAIAEATSDRMAAFQAGEFALVRYGTNYNKYISAQTSMASPDWEIGYVSTAEITGVAYPAAPYHNGIAIPTTSSNPERAIMAISLLYTDEELNHLLMYGIEGEHYTVDENGYYVEAENNSAFGYESCSSWNFRNTALMLHRESEVETLEHFEYLDSFAAKTAIPYANHEEGYSGVITEAKNEKAAIDALVTEYITPLQYGMVDDIEGTISKFMEAANKAGLEKAQNEAITLWNEYLDSKGY